MSPQAKRLAKQQLIDRLKVCLGNNGYTETAHGKWINGDGDKRWVLDGNNCKIQRKVAAVDAQYYKIPARWVNSASAPFVHLEIVNERPIKLRVDRTKTYGQ